MRPVAILVICLLAYSLHPFAQDNISYQKPPAVLEKLTLASYNPAVSFNETGEWMAILDRSSAPTVEELAQPELRIAGLRINPANFSPSRTPYYISVAIKNTGTGKDYQIRNLPANPKITSPVWNPKGNKLAFLHESRNRIDLYLLDLKNMSAIKINQTPLNLVTGFDFAWYDDDHIIYLTTISQPGAAPVKPVAPEGPVVQQNLGRTAASRTYQDLIKNKYDEDLFRFYGKSQIVINKNGIEKKIGQSGYFQDVEISPDRKFLKIEKLRGELSYLVPFSGFASQVEIWNMNGQPVKKIADIPSSELAPGGFDNVLNAPRRFGWLASKPATMGWISPLDSGLIKKEVKDHDAFVILDAPFTGKADTVLKTSMRLYTINYINDTFALVYLGSVAKQRTIWQLLDLRSGNTRTLSDRSSADAYSDPGTTFTSRNKWGKRVPLIYHQTKFLMQGTGASADGDYPFVNSFDFTTLKQEKIWQCRAPYFEMPVKILSYQDEIRLITSRQTNDEAPNYYIVTPGKNTEVTLTRFPDPQPDLRSLRKEKISYKRADGLQLTANLYVSKNYDPKRDGRLPVIMVAYPIEYKSVADAAQVRGSKHMFTMTGYGSFIPFALMGYAVMDNTEFPIVGEGDHYPNDRFVEQLEQNAKAAIDKIAAMGIGDSTRVAVAGHSYGAFMTANLLAHTPYFKAGIARSGAYNRTLTPFGFQREERTYWQAPEVYFRMSPFSYADKIKTPLLLIHGEADNNPGTFPLQSERLFNAIKGLGGTVRYVQLPFESHGYAAKENILHLLWEEYHWLEKFVKEPGK
jgi:dipeptidyl aminopeptidase/acylaminoacyl peptidase